MFRPLTLHVTDVLVRGATRRSDLVQNLGAQPLRNVRVLSQLVDTVRQSARSRVTTGDQEVNDLVGENLLVCGYTASAITRHGLISVGSSPCVCLNR